MAEQYDLRKFLPSNNKNHKNSNASAEPPKEVPILGIAQEAPEAESAGQEEVLEALPAAEQSAPPEGLQVTIEGKDEYIAKLMHELVLNCGWVPTRTYPETHYYFYTYLPPAHKRMWMQARVYITKLNLDRMTTIEGLTIPSGVQDRMTIVIRMQKSGGVGQLANSRTITQTLDTNNYFNQNSELVNEDGLQAVLMSYLKQAEIM